MCVATKILGNLLFGGGGGGGGRRGELNFDKEKWYYMPY